MADFTQIIQEINDDINTNGVGAITGAKLNEVLRDMIAAVNAEKQDTLTIDATPTEDSTNPVQSGGMYVILSTMFADGCLYGGLVEPNDQPTHGDDHRYFYLAATEGRYTHFNNYEVDGYVVVFSWNENTQNWRYVPLCPNGQAFDDLIDNKADKVTGATVGDFVGLDNNGNLTDSGSKASDFATSAQGGKADTAVQPSDLATVATSGSYNDLLNKPTIPAAQVNSDWNANSGVAQILNKPTIPDVSGKADKVVGATNGDFAGLDASGNLTDSGKKARDFATPIPVVDASTIPASMDADKVYQYGTLAGDTTFPALNQPTDLTVAHVYCWTFTTPATAPTITWPSAITAWAGGSAPTINAIKSYEVSVMDGLATIIEA